MKSLKQIFERVDKEFNKEFPDFEIKVDATHSRIPIAIEHPEGVADLGTVIAGLLKEEVKQFLHSQIKQVIQEVGEEMRQIPSTYLHQRDFIERSIVLSKLKAMTEGKQ